MFLALYSVTARLAISATYVNAETLAVQALVKTVALVSPRMKNHLYSLVPVRRDLKATHVVIKATAWTPILVGKMDIVSKRSTLSRDTGVGASTAIQANTATYQYLAAYAPYIATSVTMAARVFLERLVVVHCSIAFVQTDSQDGTVEM
jgi:hypothetical protein